MNILKVIRFVILIWIGVGSIQNAHAQDVIVRGGFFSDSLRVGDETGYYLSATYPSNLSIVFPDSTYNYSPFEFEYKRYFPTETADGKSYDSVIYYLSTFEIDKKQFLSLPVFQINPQDCTTFVSNVDTVLLAELAPDIPDSLTAEKLPLRVNIIYEDVPYLFNYPILFIAIGVLLVITAIVWIGFGKRIRKYFRLKRMLKAHQKFIEVYNQQVDAIKGAFSPSQTEHALSHWKRYMEQLESRPYTKLTTRETAQLENNEGLVKNLHSIDGAIYGHNTSVIEPLESLKNFADHRFEKKLEELKHG